jgi:protein gp37
MSDTTAIEWTDSTWNPVRGCSRMSEGCRNCYAERVAARFCGPGQPYEGLAKRKLVVIRDDTVRDVPKHRLEPGWTGQVRMVPEHVADPLKWRRPRRIFVNSMSDLFHEHLSDEQIAVVFGVMILASQHTYQVLTKRARRMREWCSRWTLEMCLDVLVHYALPSGERIRGPGPWNRPARKDWYDVETFPVPWIWLGVSVENQDAADERIPELLETLAAVRFLSCEPLLGPVDISEYFDPCSVPCGEERWPDLSWVIAGCESGPGARPAKAEWFASLRDQCQRADVPFFLKQAEEGGRITRGPDSKRKAARPGGNPILGLPMLDGEIHKAFPVIL